MPHIRLPPQLHTVIVNLAIYLFPLLLNLFLEPSKRTLQFFLFVLVLELYFVDADVFLDIKHPSVTGINDGTIPNFCQCRFLKCGADPDADTS